MALGFPGWTDINRSTVRAPVNPMDKSTVVSIYPREIVEEKCTLQPGTFVIPAGSKEKPGILTVTSCSWWREIDPKQPLLEIPVASILVADSIVKDWCTGLLAYSKDTASPGLFYIPGEHTVADIKIKFTAPLLLAETRQRKWYQDLVKMADVLWSRTNGNPLSISDIMRLAARELGLEDKEWLKDYQHAQMVRCHACGVLKNPTFPVCANCRVVDPNYKGEIKFAS